MLIFCHETASATMLEKLNQTGKNMQWRRRRKNMKIMRLRRKRKRYRQRKKEHHHIGLNVYHTDIGYELYEYVCTFLCLILKYIHHIVNRQLQWIQSLNQNWVFVQKSMKLHHLIAERIHTHIPSYPVVCMHV